MIPVIVKMWKEEQEKLAERLSYLEGGVVVSGDSVVAICESSRGDLSFETFLKVLRQVYPM